MMTESKNSQKLYIETYGCQMNVSDSEIVVSILEDKGYTITEDINEADTILVNTCSIRENAEQRVWGRLDVFKQIKKKKPELIVGVIGCMAERLKEKLLEEEKVVDLVVGPDAYRDLPNLLDTTQSGQKAINVLLSKEETYADISPVRLDKNKISAFVSIMRGCNNMCTYCIVPYVRGAERSRDPETIVKEVEELQAKGYKEVTLLGQNVDSYNWDKGVENKSIKFSQLLEMVAKVSPKLRVRFSTSHPKDMSDDVLYTMAMYNNICNHIHLPAQSGSTNVLEKMKRKYTREWYIDRINAINKILPNCAVSTDIMTGFPGETDEDHKETLSLMEFVKYDIAYMFKYSERPKTYASRHLKDDIPESVKSTRLTEIIDLQIKLSAESKKADLGKTFEVLVEGVSKKSTEHLYGRTSQNKVVVFPKNNYQIGDYVFVEIIDCTSATLIGEIATK
ncbi:MAG: tRNA (N6-isopentenyl adenosine(37)-C2)-methylthiotransferase MiaB [Bacteroidales bacterium]|nr:tRNA (N6-isopentenyl adenosine(37)-C2)-methylthiotransferase MiaB [Bacteroidales bacterium]